MRTSRGATHPRPRDTCVTAASVHLGGLAQSRRARPLLSRKPLRSGIRGQVTGSVPMDNRQRAFHPSWIPLLLLVLAFAFHLASPQSGTGGSIAGQVADSGGRLFPALV